MSFAVYSLADTHTVLSHPQVGKGNLHRDGVGKIVVSRSGDLSSHTATADGYVVVNRLKSENGSIVLEVPQNSAADEFLRRWAGYLQSVEATEEFAASTLTIRDTAGGLTITATGVTPQKIPDRTWDRTATNLTYTLLAASIREKAVGFTTVATTMTGQAV